MTGLRSGGRVPSMARAVTRLWYRIAMMRADGSRALVAAEGEHLGAAIAAAEHARKGSRALAAEVCSEADIPLGESVGKERVVELGPLGANGASRDPGWPTGVLPSLGQATDAQVQRGYVVRTTTEPGLVIEAQTDAANLVDLFLGLVERLPAADNLEIRVLDHFEATGTTDVWLTSRTNAKQVLRFLDDQDSDTILNGHVEVSVYLRQQRATLRLTEHKTVLWLADDRALEADITRWLGELGLARVDALTTIATVPHFHYRPAGTRDRKKLGELLSRQRMRRVDVLRADRLTAG